MQQQQQQQQQQQRSFWAGTADSKVMMTDLGPSVTRGSNTGPAQSQGAPSTTRHRDQVWIRGFALIAWPEALLNIACAMVVAWPVYQNTSVRASALQRVWQQCA
jgi:hypothetical protein